MAETHTNPLAEDAIWRAEQERRYRLLHMGLQPLVSRFDAVGAKPAFRALPPDSSGDNQSTPTEIPTSFKALLNTAGDTKPAHQVAGEGAVSNAQTERAKIIQTTTRLPASDLETTGEAAFSVVILRACGWLWVEGLEDGLLRQEQILLTQAMARAISDQATQANPQWQQFDWPMVDHASLARDRETGIHMLRGLLSRITKEHAVKGTIVMGCHPVVETAIPAVQATIPGTLEMLENPLKKADAWHVLRPLRAPRS